MSSKIPPIPPEQRAVHGDSQVTVDDSKATAPKGNSDLNLEQQGRHGNLHQNVETVHARTQDR